MIAQDYTFGQKYDTASTEVNTVIGGAAKIWTTKTELATNLGIAETDISHFEVIDNDIYARIEVSYNIPDHIFQNYANRAYYKGYGAIITSYLDLEGMVWEIGSNCFTYQSNLRDIYFPEVVNLHLQTFENTRCRQYVFPKATFVNNHHVFNLTYAKLIYLPLVTGDSINNFYATKNVYIPALQVSLGTDFGDNGVFADATSGDLNIWAHPDHQTSNAGSEEGDIAYARNSKAAIINYTTTGHTLITEPYPVTNLRASEVKGTSAQILFDQPASANAILEYEVYLDDKYSKFQTISGSGDYLRGLQENTSYKVEVVAIDIYGNKSSREATTLTTTQATVPTDGLIAYYAMEQTSGNVIDSHGTNDGTNNGVTRGVAGKKNNGFYFPVGAGHIATPVDLAAYTHFAMSWWFKTSFADDGAIHFMVAHRPSVSNNGESFRVSIEGGQIWVRVYGYVNFVGTFNDGAWHHIVVNAPQTMNTSSLEVYIDGVKLEKQAETYADMALVSSNINIGGDTTQNYYYDDGDLDEMAIYGNKNLTLEEISELYNNGNGITI